MTGETVLTNRTLEWLEKKGLCSAATRDTLAGQGITRLTTVQLLAIPPLLTKSSLFIHARTGSGKTLAFLIPIVERLRAMQFKKERGVGALIISPTRELAQQIGKVLQPLATAHGYSCLTVTGGTKLKKTDTKEGCVLVVGTPGKLADVLGSQGVCVSCLRILVLDEADRLLDDGSHTQQVRKIYSMLPKDKVQKVLVSATMTKKCTDLAEEIFKADFSYITAEKSLQPTTAKVKQNYIIVRSEDRLSMLVRILKTLKKKKVIVFFSSCLSVKFHYKVLTCLNLPVMYCMGQEKQGRRSNTYDKFVEVDKGTLLTTAMAERGWDIPAVHWIIQYDPPHKPQDYVHRVGRTSRGEGHTGQALIFLRPEEEQFIGIVQGMDVDFKQIEFNGELMGIQEQINSIVAENVELQQMGKLAYKKYVRAYQCHKLKKVFDINLLNLSEVCKGFGFLKPPLELGQLT